MILSSLFFAMQLTDIVVISHVGPAHSDVLAWLGLKASGFGLAWGGLGLLYLQARPEPWLWVH